MIVKYSKRKAEGRQNGREREVISVTATALSALCCG